MSLLSFSQKAAWAVLPALLLLFCQWLANTMTEKDVVINYKVTSQSVNGLHTVYIEFSNYAEVAIDKVTIASGPANVLESSYDPQTKGTTTNVWEGEIFSGQTLKALYVLNKEMPISASSLSSLLDAEYRKRNKETGQLEWTKVNLNEGHVFVSGTIAYLMWFFAPILISLFGVFLVYKLRSRRAQSGGTAP
ncbi:TPA: hypothetical protein ACVOYJ_004501 [Vibrio diabolicus]